MWASPCLSAGNLPGCNVIGRRPRLERGGSRFDSYHPDQFQLWASHQGDGASLLTKNELGSIQRPTAHIHMLTTTNDHWVFGRMARQRTFNPRDAGSIPAGPTKQHAPTLGPIDGSLRLIADQSRLGQPRVRSSIRSSGVILPSIFLGLL